MDKLIDLCGIVYRESTDNLNSKIKFGLKNKNKMFIITANPEIITLGTEDEKMNLAMHNSTIITADGVGVEMAIKWKFKERCYRNTGIDIVQFLFGEAKENGYSCFLYGAKPEVLNDLVRKCNQQYPRMRIVGACDGYRKDKDKIRSQIINSGADIILVALGAPKQECFIDSFFNDIGHGICVGVGGVFDVLSGHSNRAPKFFISHNLEWLYRITTEPKRLKRFLNGNVCFFIKLLFQNKRVVP